MKDQFLKKVESKSHVDPESFREEIIKAFNKKDAQRIQDIKDSWCKVAKEEDVIDNLRCAANYADMPSIGSGELAGACKAMQVGRTLGPISKWCKEIINSLVTA